ncbi:MAG TPA: hypothetical protein VMJ10_12970 [Kofleriaceae bacterium]|nr:hypothetical protein [Kofleriaceae bacterium]
MDRSLTLPLLVACSLVARTARADSPKLDQARAALAQVRYDSAQALLAGALQDGGNSPAAVREIYRLSAAAAIVLDHRDVGEQYYRRWLALDPAAALSADDSPKLHEVFDAARAYITAHGSLRVAASRNASGIDVVVSSDPLAMAAAVAASSAGTPSSPVALGAEHRAHLDAPADAIVVVLDDLGNHLLETTPAALAAPPPTQPDLKYPPPPEPPPPPPPRPILKRWTTWGVPFALTATATILLGSFAIAENDDIGEAKTPAEAADNRTTRDQLIWATAITGAAAVAFGIPMSIFFFDTPGAKLPSLPGAGAGVMVVGRF